jgi:hypothetical protein
MTFQQYGYPEKLFGLFERKTALLQLLEFSARQKACRSSLEMNQA